MVLVVVGDSVDCGAGADTIGVGNDGGIAVSISGGGAGDTNLLLMEVV